MSFDPFPERIDPQKLFTRNAVINGFIKLDRLQRLRAYLSNDDGQVNVSLSFDRDASNKRLLSGTINAKIHMLCQRCLKETSVVLESTLNVLVLSDKQWNAVQEESLPKGFEAVKASDDELDVTALIEDELILSLPIVVHHEASDCSKELNKLQASTQSEGQESSNNPFAGLQVLKNKT